MIRHSTRRNEVGREVLPLQTPGMRSVPTWRKDRMDDK